jgi:transcriptional regulator with XRE-family HTH domain
MKRLGELKKQLMNDPDFRRKYAEADAEYSVIESLIRSRVAANLSQAELAHRLGTTQSAIARLEGGGVSPSLSTLRRYAEATGRRLKVTLERKESAA